MGDCNFSTSMAAVFSDGAAGNAAAEVVRGRDCVAAVDDFGGELRSILGAVVVVALGKKADGTSDV